MCLGNGTSTFTGSYVTFRLNNLAEDTSIGHINEEMWNYTQSDSNKWVEGGVREGSEPQQNNPCGCKAYELFWADVAVSSGVVNENFHHIANTSPTGALVSFEALVQSGTHQTSFYYN